MYFMLSQHDCFDVYFSLNSLGIELQSHFDVHWVVVTQSATIIIIVAIMIARKYKQL